MVVNTNGPDLVEGEMNCCCSIYRRPRNAHRNVVRFFAQRDVSGNLSSQNVVWVARLALGTVSFHTSHDLHTFMGKFQPSCVMAQLCNTFFLTNENTLSSGPMPFGVTWPIFSGVEVVLVSLPRVIFGTVANVWCGSCESKIFSCF